MIKKLLPMTKGVVIVVFLLSTCLFVGCTSEQTNDTVFVSYPVMSSLDGEVLDTAYQQYAVLRKAMNASDSRSHLLGILNNETEGIEVAELGLDGYTIFVTFSDGDLAMIDTYELDEGVQQNVMFSPPNYNHRSNEYFDMKNTITFEGFASEIPLFPGDVPQGYTDIQYNIKIVGPAEKTTCESKKLLVLGPCYYEFPTEPTDAAINLFRTYGWSEEDITLKLVSIHPSYENTDCMNLTPDDYFNLSDYGILLFSGHGAVKVKNNFDEDNLYLQFCFLDNASFLNNKELQRWRDEKKLLVGQRFIVGEGKESRYIYMTGIRADVLREKVKTLPKSFCYFSTCYGGYFNKVYLDKGAQIFLGWNNRVEWYHADENMKNIIELMLEKNWNVYDAYADTSIIKSYDIRHPDNTSRNLFIQPPTSYNVKFSIYPDPATDTIAKSFYFPGWFSLTIDDIFEDTSILRVKVMDNSSNVLSTVEKKLNPGQTKIYFKYVGGILAIPEERVKISVIALTNNYATIFTKTLLTTPSESGKNNITMNISGYIYQIGGNNSPFMDFSEGFSVAIYLNNELIKIVPGKRIDNPFADCDDTPTMGCPVYLKAKPGDTLKLIITCDWDTQYSISHHYGDIWLSQMDNSEYKVRLLKEQWFDPDDTGGSFDITATIPDFDENNG